jgi:hypothetical protein
MERGTMHMKILTGLASIDRNVDVPRDHGTPDDGKSKKLKKSPSPMAEPPNAMRPPSR